jgi:hypothetical protein
MRLSFQMLPMLFFALAGFGSEIREFDLRTIERLGNELSRRDAMAARASDLVLANHPELKKGPLLEWVTDLSNGGSVYWIVDTEPQPTPVYKVVSGRIEDIRGRPLPAAIQTRYNARRNAIKAVLPKLKAAYGVKYNFEVLNDPDGSGFLVYGLAATNKVGKQLFGGHVRVTVSADGLKAEHVDELSQGILKSKLGPQGSKNLGFATYDPTSKIPVETWIYSSKLYGLPIFVGCEPNVYWEIWNGKMHKLTKAEIDAAERGTEKQK